MARKVANTPLAHAIADLVDRYGSDEKLASAIGDGATRFTVMRWRVEGTVPEKRFYVERLRELGVDGELLERAAGDELASRRSLIQRVGQLEDEVSGLSTDVDDLTTALDAAKQAHSKLLRRVSALEKAAAPPQDARPAARSSRRAQSGR